MCTPAGLRRSRRVVPGERRRRSSTRRLSGSHEVDRVLQGPRDSIAPNPIQGQHHTMAEDTTEPRTSWMAPSSRQEQLVSGMPARATPVWLPRELALKSLRSFRRFLENLKGLQRSGKRNTLSGTPEEGIASQPWPANKPLERAGVNARADIVGASAGRSAPSHPLGRDSCGDPAAALLSSRSLSGR